MLNASDQKVLEAMISQMGAIINAIPGEPFTTKDADTLVIMQRRLPESELKKQLSQYNEIFVKQSGAGIPDITNSMISYIRMKVLLESGVDCFDGKAYRELFKECKSQITRINNIIRLTKTSSLTAEEYQKDKIEAMLEKNEAFIVCIENEMSHIEKKLERLPKEEETVEVAQKEKPKKDVVSIPARKDGFLAKLEKKMAARKEKKEIGNFLKNEEKKQSLTCCEEVPFYDRSLSFQVSMVCKDIPAYSLMKRKNNVYFGLSKNVVKSIYDNSDGTLLELTKASEEFWQFMTEDLLGGEYNLNPFSEDEKEGMQMYFDFISRCFEAHIGVTLTVREYLNFKIYYNQLVSMMFELERQEKEDYYKALILADRYLCYMKSYGLGCADERDEVITNLIAEDNEAYISDIELIISNHIVDTGAKEDIEKLIADIKHFHEKEEVVIQSEIVPEPVEVLPKIPVQGPTQNNYMQIVIQLLDGKREVIDEALYASDNIRQALLDFERKDACVKRLGFRNNGVDVFYKEEVNR